MRALILSLFILSNMAQGNTLTRSDCISKAFAYQNIIPQEKQMLCLAKNPDFVNVVNYLCSSRGAMSPLQSFFFYESAYNKVNREMLMARSDEIKERTSSYLKAIDRGWMEEGHRGEVSQALYAMTSALRVCTLQAN